MRGYGSRGTASIAGSGSLSCGRDWDGGWCGGGDGNQDRMAEEQDGFRYPVQCSTVSGSRWSSRRIDEACFSQHGTAY